MEDIDKKVIVITGGAGFIGSHLCMKYVNEGHTVYCIDNLQTTNSTRNIDDLLLRRNFVFIKQDVLKPIRIKQKVDWIFNLACSGSYTSYQFDPVHTTRTNTEGVINVLELARQHSARVLQASTSEVYGDPLETPQKESYTGNVNTLGPRACYDEGKRCAETLFMDYHREYAVDVRIIRIFNTYGPNMAVNDGRLVSNFIMRALSDEDLIIYGDGGNTRSFQYIDDLIRAMDRMMQQDDFLGPVNIGNPGERTVTEFGEAILRMTKSKSKLVYSDPGTDDPKRRSPDISLAKEKLGWEPEVSFEEGIKKTIEYFKTVERPDQKVLVFATTYYPDLGPAEKALHRLSNEMPKTEFHIITTHFKKNRESVEMLGKDTIYRVGYGSTFDKYLLPFLGFKKALELHKEHNYRFVWSVMASYGAFAALLLKLFARDLRFLMTFDSSQLHEKSNRKLTALLPIYRYLFKRADTVFVSDLNHERTMNLLTSDIDVTVIPDDTRTFMNRVRHHYAKLINEQERKLERVK